MSALVARPWLAVICATLLSACSSEKAPPPPEPPASVPYDGPWAQLPETGEWTDRGALSPCTLLKTSGSRSCDYWDSGSPLELDLSRCETGPLTGLERQGAIYRAELRIERRDGTVTPRFGGFRFDSSGRLVTLMGAPADGDSPANPRRVLSSYRSFPNGGFEYSDFVGCQATGPRTLTGCFRICTSGRQPLEGTFRAERMVWRENEPESSGITLVSESRVEQGSPVDVYVTKGHAYVVSVDLDAKKGGLTVFDVSDPRGPVHRTTLTLPNDSFWNGVWAKDDALYVASAASGVIVYDISNPASPVLVRKVTGSPNADLHVHTVFVEGNRLYAMAPYSKAIRIFDISDPLSPAPVSSYAYPNGKDYPHDSFAFDGRLYINHLGDGFLVVDISGETPTLLGRYDYPHVFSHANAVGVFNGRTLAFEGGETFGSHLRVLDVTNPAGIAKVGEYRLRDVASIHNMVLVGSRLYIAYYHEGVRVLDVSDPTQPREVAHFNTFREADPERTDGMSEGAMGIRVPGDGYVYAVETSRGLLIFDEP